MRSPRKSTSASWPFWLLVAAWICANSPQAATYAFLDWIGQANSFSHQQRLTSDVAYLLGGQKKPVMAVSFQESPTAASKPAIPADASLKKIELAVEKTTAAAVPSPAANDDRSVVDAVWEGAGRAQPPHEPPRVALAS